MSDLETINGKTYKRVPLELNGEIVKFVLVEVAPTPVAQIVAEPEQVESFSDEISEASEALEAPVEHDIQEEETPEEVSETVEAASDSESQLGFQTEEEEESVAAPELAASPIAHQKTIEEHSVIENDDSDTRSESSTGSSTLEQSSDYLEEFPGLNGESELKATKDQPHTATATLDTYEFTEDLKVCAPARLSEFYLIAVDGNYVFNWDDLNRFWDGCEHNLVFQKTPNSINRSDRRAVCYKPTYKTLQKIQVRTGPGSNYDASGVIPANEQVFVIQEGLLSCNMELVVEWMTLHLSKGMVCEELLGSNAQTFDEYIERTVLLSELRKCSDLEFNENDFLFAFETGKVKRFAKRVFPHEHEEFVHDVRVAVRAMKTKAKTEKSTLEAFAEATYKKSNRNKFVNAAKAANRKVKVMWTEDGVEKSGWISKKKNNKSGGDKKTKPLITRVMGATAAPQVQVFNISADIPSLLPRLDCSFSKDAYHFKENAKRKVPSRYFKGEDETVHCFPPMSFYHKLAKSEIAKIVGSKRFNISWEGEFNLNRFRGLDKKRVVCDDGKTRLRTGYHVPNTYMTITFQRYSDANAFLNANFDDTRFSGADAEACGSYANLHPVDAAFCPEFEQYELDVKRGNAEFHDSEALDRGIHYVSV